MISHIGIKEDIIRLLHEFSDTWTDRPPGYGIKSRGPLLPILYRLLELGVYKNLTSRDFRVEKAVRYITRNFTKPITVKNLAA